MKKIFFYKTLKALLGLGLIIKGIEFINISSSLVQEMNEHEPHPNISYFDYIQDSNEYLLPGLFIVLFGMNLIYHFTLLFKALIVYSLAIPICFLSLFVLDSVFYQNINISFNFIISIFSYAGMCFFSFLLCFHYNFDWRNQIKNSYKIALIIGVSYAIINFIWRIYSLRY